MQPVASPAKIWTDLSGRTVDAEFLSCDGKIVVLKSNKSGNEIKVPLDRLSMPDKAIALFKLHEQKAKAASEEGSTAPVEAPGQPQPTPPVTQQPPPPQPAPTPPAAPVTPAPDPAAGNAPPELESDLPPATEAVRELIGDIGGRGSDTSGGGAPDEEGGFDKFANSLEDGDYGGLIRGVGLVFFLAGVLSLILLWVLIATIGIYLISIFLDFKETFGTALMFGIGSTAIRTFFEICQAVMINISPSVAPTVDNLLVRWMLIIAVYYPFDAFLIRRIYRADLATATRAAGAYFLWSRITTRIIFAVMAAATLAMAASSGESGMPPGLGQ